MEVALLNCSTVALATLAAYQEDGCAVRTLTALLHSCSTARVVLCAGFLCSIALSVWRTKEPLWPAAIAWGVLCVLIESVGLVHDVGALVGFAGMLATARSLFHGSWHEWLGWLSACTCFTVMSAFLQNSVFVELGLFLGVHVPLLFSL